jgi:hypothetical protein
VILCAIWVSALAAVWVCKESKMATNEGVGQAQVPDDPATAAFEALRKE